MKNRERGIGDNSGNTEISDEPLIDVNALRRRLPAANHDLFSQRDALLATVKHWNADHLVVDENGSPSKDDQGRPVYRLKGASDLAMTGELYVKLRKFAGDAKTSVVEKARVALKEPVLEAGRAIDDFMIRTIAQPVRDAMEANKRAQQEHALAELLEIEARNAAEVARLMKVAEKLAEDPDQIDAALRAEERANTTGQILNSVPTPDMTRVYGPTTKTSASDYWDYEVTNSADVPRHLCTHSDPLIKNAIDRGVRDIPGVRIFRAVRINNR